MVEMAQFDVEMIFTAPGSALFETTSLLPSDVIAIPEGFVPADMTVSNAH
jgi:hypothetical protein